MNITTHYTKEFWEYLKSLNFATKIGVNRSAKESDNFINFVFRHNYLEASWGLKTQNANCISHCKFLEAFTEHFKKKELDFFISGHKVYLGQNGITIGHKDISFKEFYSIKAAVDRPFFEEIRIATKYCEKFFKYIKSIELNHKLDGKEDGTGYIVAYRHSSTGKDLWGNAHPGWEPYFGDEFVEVSHAQFLSQITNLKRKPIHIVISNGNVVVSEEIVFSVTGVSMFKISNEEFRKLSKAVDEFHE